jgi:hypothetical protein
MLAQLQTVATLSAVVALSACSQLREASLPDLAWGTNCTPEILDQPGDSDILCDFWVTRSSLIVLPVEDRALEIWRTQRDEMEFRPFAGDVIAVIGTDETGSFTYPEKDRIYRDTNLSGQALWRRALRNTDAFAWTAEITAYADGRMWVDSQYISAATLIFAESFWRRPELARFAGPPLMATIGRSAFWVMDSARPDALERLGYGKDQCMYSSATYPGFCSRAGHVFMRAPDGSWSVVDENTLPPPMCSLLDEYDRLAAEAVRASAPTSEVDSKEQVQNYRRQLQCGDDASRLAATLEALRANLSR